MSNEDLEKKYEPLITEPLKFKDITNVNHKPHPYMIGTKHVAYASDHCGGMLGEEVMEKIPCAHPHCTSSYDDHVSDLVMFLQLTRSCTQEEAKAVITTDLGKQMEEDGIAGICFVETAEEYRVGEPDG